MRVGQDEDDLPKDRTLSMAQVGLILAPRPAV